ncbi:MAG: ATP-binding protein [Marmoricola sp.]
MSALPGVRRVGLALAEGGGRRLLFTASDRASESDDVDWCHIDAYERVPLNTAVRSGSPVHGSLGVLRIRFPDFVDNQPAGTAAVAAVPICAAGQTLGGFVLFLSAGARLDAGQVEELCGLGEDLGAGLRRARRRGTGQEWDAGMPPPSEGGRVALHVVPPELAAAAGARRFLDATLAEWGVPDDARHTAQLCLSELVTNALIHTHGGCQVRALLEDGVLTVGVRDRGAGEGVKPRANPDPDPLAVHGRGLQVVAALAARWGSEVTLGGTTVWFVLDLDR